jgi:hypothetical protein
VLRFEPVDVLLIQEVEAINIWDVPQAMLLAVLTRGNVSNVVLVEDGNAKGIWLVRWKIFHIDGNMCDVIPCGRRAEQVAEG